MDLKTSYDLGIAKLEDRLELSRKQCGLECSATEMDNLDHLNGIGVVFHPINKNKIERVSNLRAQR